MLTLEVPCVFDRLAYSGGVIMINDTAVITLCRKQSTTAYNTTEAELDAPATTLSKHVLWLRIYMEDMSIPCHDAISIGEDNSAAASWHSSFYLGLVCSQFS